MRPGEPVRFDSRCLLPSADAPPAAPAPNFESGRRESNPRSQLGKRGVGELADDGEQERQVSDSTDAGERPGTDPNAP